MYNYTDTLVTKEESRMNRRLKKSIKKYIKFMETDQTLKLLEKGRVSRETQIQYITTLYRKEKRRLETEINKFYRRRNKRLRELGMTRSEMNERGINEDRYEAPSRTYRSK